MAIINKGEVLLSGKPDDTISEIQGKIWRKTIEKTQLKHYQENFQVISTRLVAGKPVVHLYSAVGQPESGFTQVEASLEDVYFRQIDKAVRNG
jgi:ABC-type multidrug transport system ATPase subunit